MGSGDAWRGLQVLITVCSGNLLCIAESRVCRGLRSLLCQLTCEFAWFNPEEINYGFCFTAPHPSVSRCTYFQGKIEHRTDANQSSVVWSCECLSLWDSGEAKKVFCFFSYNRAIKAIHLEQRGHEEEYEMNKMIWTLELLWLWLWKANRTLPTWRGCLVSLQSCSMKLFGGLQTNTSIWRWHEAGAELTWLSRCWSSALNQP